MPDDKLKTAALAKLLELAAGSGLVLLGVAGLILPVMPGWVFLIPGLVILSRHFHWARRLLDWAKEQKAKHVDPVLNKNKPPDAEPPQT